MTRDEIIDKLTDGKITKEEAKSLLAQTESKAVTMKVSDQGCITFRSMPGGNVSFGTYLRRETLQWLYANRERVEKFMKDNEKEITKRSEASREAKKAA